MPRFAFQTHDKLFMVTEYCRGGELFFHLKKYYSTALAPQLPLSRSLAVCRDTNHPSPSPHLPLSLSLQVPCL